MGITESAAARLVPKPFRDFLKLVSPSALGVIHKERVLKLALKIAQQSFSTQSDKKEYQATRTRLSHSGLAIQLVDSAEWDRLIGSGSALLPLDSLEAKQKVSAGQRILELYFFLIHEATPLELDLRPHHFLWDDVRGVLHWKPSSLFLNRSEDFRQRVIGLYSSFFTNDSAGRLLGLSLYRWECEPKEGYDERIEFLMRKHFGSAVNESVRFSSSGFRETFHLIFTEAVQYKSRFHPELTFLGTTLAGMYVTLEKLGCELDVAKAYFRVKGLTQ